MHISMHHKTTMSDTILGMSTRGTISAVGVVPAAGRGARFADADPTAPPKMLAPVDGVPMVRRTVESLLAAGVDRCIVVAAESGREGITRALSGLPVEVVVNPDPSRGMFSSVQCGVMAADPSDLCVLLPGDMPFVQPATIAAVVATAQGGAHTVTPSLHGHRGHPVVCGGDLRARILAADADARLDHLMAQEPVLTVDVTDTGVRRDLDTPAELSRGGR